MVSVWFVFQQKDRQLCSTARRRLGGMCREQGWSFAERETRAVRDVEGRPLSLLSTRDANELYRAAHRDLVSIVDSCSTSILRDPRDQGGRISALRTVRLRHLFRYKALIFDKHAFGDADAIVSDVVSQSGAMEKELAGRQIDDTDPRALPFIPFDLGARRDEDLELETEGGRATFVRDFGPARRRRDSQNVSWVLDQRAYHGKDALLIRGHKLPVGCHWDVQVDRGAVFLCTSAEVWHIKEGQYLNIYPDMHARRTRRAGGKRVWPENT